MKYTVREENGMVFRTSSHRKSIVVFSSLTRNLLLAGAIVYIIIAKFLVGPKRDFRASFSGSIESAQEKADAASVNRQ